MKAGIITHYDVHNHGAHLQMYALARMLGDLGYEAKALRYSKNYDFMGGAKIKAKYDISLRSLPIYAKYLLKNGLRRSLYNYKKRKLLSRFRKAQDLIGPYFCEAEDLDAVVIGSDEIFSTEAGPNPWFYGIGVPCKNRISYAASFGPTSLDDLKEQGLDAMVAAGLKDLKAISVRDRNSFDVVKHLVNKEAEITCDPVLLYGFKEEQSEAALKAFRRKHKERYCIVYAYDDNMNDSVTVESIRAYAQKRGLKVYSIGYYHEWCDENPILSPLELIAWFSSAEMVFTDTFHGTVLSLVTGTQFVSKIAKNANKLGFLLEQYGLSRRLASDFSQIEEIASQRVDYRSVEKTIAEIRRDSAAFLKTALENLR